MEAKKENKFSMFLAVKIEAYDSDITRPRDNRAMSKAIRHQVDEAFGLADDKWIS